ncbi:MAG: DUF2341 domain-containing protein [Candidatus Bathyarchaeia archaeon]
MSSGKPFVNLRVLTTSGKVVDLDLYCHQETVAIAGVNYFLLKDVEADTSGVTLSVSVGTTGKKLLTYNGINSRFVFKLTGVSRILSGTINAVYRAYTGGGTVNGVIDILIRKSDGSVRTTIATSVSPSGNWGTSWATYTGSAYNFSEYTVVDQTDYLEVDFFANVTAKKTGQYCYLRVDDNTLPKEDQTRTIGWNFPPLLAVTTLQPQNVDIGVAVFHSDIYYLGTIVTIAGFEWRVQGTQAWLSTVESRPGGFPRGKYSRTILNLQYGVTYEVRAKAYSEDVGWVYGGIVTFTAVAIRCLNGWRYRKAHEIVGSTAGAVTNYPVHLVLHYGSGTDSGEHVYLNGKCRPDFADIRFTADDGYTVIPHWIEEKVDGDYAYVWVKVPSIPASPNSVKIYIYYGRSDAPPVSNQMAVGIAQLKEHKYHATYDPDIRFYKVDNQLNIDSVDAGPSSLGHGYCFFVLPASLVKGKWIRVKWSGYFSYSNLEHAYIDIWDGSYYRASSTDFPSGGGKATKGNGLLARLAVATAGGSWGPVIVDKYVNVSPSLPYVTLFIMLNDAWAAQTVELFIEFVEINDCEGGGENIYRMTFTEEVVMEVTGTYNDYGVVRKIVTPEPSHGIWYPEESIPEAVAIVPNGFKAIYSRSVFFKAFIYSSWRVLTSWWVYYRIKGATSWISLDIGIPSGVYVFEDVLHTAGLEPDTIYEYYLKLCYLDDMGYISSVVSDIYEFKTKPVKWLTGWRYRKLDTIKPAAPVSVRVYDYQIKVVVHYGSGTDSGEHVYLNGKCRPDFADIRFTADDGVTKIPYWIGEKVDGDYAYVWVKVPYIGMWWLETYIYIYYGNPTAVSESNGVETFIFFDDFETGDFSRWDSASGWEIVTDIVKQGNYAIHGSPQTQGVLYKSLPTISYRHKWHVYVRFSDVGSGKYSCWFQPLSVICNTPIHPIDLYDNYLCLHFISDSSVYRFSWSNAYVNAGTWYKIELDIDSFSPTIHAYGYLNDASIGSKSITDYYDRNAPGIKGLILATTGNVDVWVDLIYIRRYLSPEPTHVAWQPEESVARRIFSDGFTWVIG